MFDPAACPPRGRWMLVRYVKAYGDTTSLKAFIYEVVATGAGFPSDPGDREYFAPGDLVLVDQAKTIQLENSYAFVNFDDGVLARWNDAFDEPTVLYSSIYGEVDAYYPVSKGVHNFGEAVSVRVLSVDSAITDIAPDDIVLVPRSKVVNVGKRANTRFVFRAEDVLSVCSSGGGGGGGIGIDSVDTGSEDIAFM